jgi:hypothetical protein
MTITGTKHPDCQDECQTAAARGPAYRCDGRQCDMLACEEYDALRKRQSEAQDAPTAMERP